MVNNIINKVEKNKIVIGKKQTLRALLKDEAEKVYISRDADFHVTEPIVQVCKDKVVEILYFDNMKDLGIACGIDVNAAAAAVLK
jgi:large subunit ribosomal protein L7A